MQLSKPLLKRGQATAKKSAKPRPLSVLEETFALHCKAKKIDVVREFKFHPDRAWRFDFAIPEKMIAIECEGGIWGASSRHTTGKGFIADCEKYNYAAAAGWFVFRFDDSAIKSGAAIKFIAEVLAQRKDINNN